jgi:hypothetical protein
MAMLRNADGKIDVAAFDFNRTLDREGSIFIKPSLHPLNIDLRENLLQLSSNTALTRKPFSKSAIAEQDLPAVALDDRKTHTYGLEQNLVESFHVHLRSPRALKLK